eukprot:1140568-Prymnesium_polylepis.1
MSGVGRRRRVASATRTTPVSKVECKKVTVTSRQPLPDAVADPALALLRWGHGDGFTSYVNDVI